VFSPSSYRIFFAQLVCWISLLLTIATFETQWILLSILFYFLYAAGGVALIFHRTLSHNSFKFNPVVKKFLILWSCLANVGSPLTWVAVHRAHHKYCDTKQDPHSPLHNGFWFMMFGSMFARVSVKHVRDLLRDPFMIFTHKYYYVIQVPWICLLYYIGGWKAVVACHLVPGGLTWLAGSFLNWYNHLYGYKNFDIKDSSKNSALTGILVFGEGWHNNHHAKPISSTTAVLKTEFDPIYYVGRLFGGKPTIK